MILAVVRGGGDLASGVAVRLFRSGIKVVVAEIPQPLAVRRLVSFAQAIYSSTIQVEEISGRRIDNTSEIIHDGLINYIPVIVDPDLVELLPLHPQIIVDARMTKFPPEEKLKGSQFVIGIGPGFIAGKNCDCVIESKRGPNLGRVYWVGSAEPDSGLPDKIGEYEKERVLRAPKDGVIKSLVNIGDIIEQGEPIAKVDDTRIYAPFRGVLRGLIHDDLTVTYGLKVGDLDPRCDSLLCKLVSEKALAIGGGVLEAVLSQKSIRENLCN